jgi:NAD(P)-dependent dehydrogenase (short-subunit alcohol dehydrogenase family)
MRVLEKQVVLVTGASSGMGKEAAIALAREGHVVYGAARRVSRMLDLEQAGGHALELDVTDDAQVRKVVAGILEATGAIDVLVNNAGYAVYGAVEDISLDDARQQFEAFDAIIMSQVKRPK